MALSVVQWVGGKGNQLDDLLPLIPYDHGYCEPFGGGASVLMNRSRSEVEVYNDLNLDVVALFRCLQDPVLFITLANRLYRTPWAKDEFRRALYMQQAGRMGDPAVSWIDRAWALVVIQNMGISGAHSKTEGNWSRSLADDKNTEKWQARLEKLEAVHMRFRNVQVDSQDALACMNYWDAPTMVFYVDPPYVLDTRGNRIYYEFEMDETEHKQMVDVLLQLQGAVVLSGYDSPIYDPLIEAGWETTEYKAYGYAKIVAAAEGEVKPMRKERIWRNPRCLSRGVQLSLL